MLMLTSVACSIVTKKRRLRPRVSRTAYDVLHIHLYLKRRAPTGQSLGEISILSLGDLLPHLALAQFSHQLSYC